MNNRIIDPSARPDKARILVEPSDGAKLKLLMAAGLAALAAVTFLYGLGELALVGPDEPRYAEVAREMMVTGDFISPRLCGCLWFEKPALYYWTTAAAYRVFGVGEFAARFPSAAAAGLTVLLIGYAARRVLSTRAGLLGALVLITSGIFIGYARAATTDMLLACSVTAALLAGFLAADGDGRARLWFWALCGSASGLSVLAKGLVGVVLVGAVLAVYLVATRRLRSFGWRQCLTALTCFLVVMALWYLPVTLRHGWDFIDQFFIDHHFRRYVSNRFSHPQPFYFYPAVTFLGVAPWSFLLITAAARIRKLKPSANKLDALLVLAWIAVAVPVVFFSFSESKLPGYILPVFPFLAVIVTIELERLWLSDWTRGLKLATWLTAVLLLVLVVGAALYVRSWPPAPSGRAIVLLWAPVALGLVTALMLVLRRPHLFVAGVAATVACVVVGATTLLFPRVNDVWSLRALSLEAAAALEPGERIGFFIYKEFAPTFYAEGRVACGYGDGTILNALKQDKLAAALESESSMVIITLSRWQDDLEQDPRFLMEFIGSQGDALAFRVRLRR